jgi:hypothetical protein
MRHRKNNTEDHIIVALAVLQAVLRLVNVHAGHLGDTVGVKTGAVDQD